jgi:hypothetical protein
MFEDPFASNNVGTWWPVNQTPGAIVLERVELGSHGSVPVWIL